MKTLITIMTMALMVSVAFTTTAQERKHGEKRSEIFKQELGLTDEQAKQVELLRAKYKGMGAAVRQDNENDKEAMRAELKELHAQMDEELKTILSDEQMVKYAELKEQKMAKRKAQAKEKKMMREDKRAVHKEMREYYHANVMPTLLKQRAKLDEEMSKKDRKTIDKAREDLKVIRAKYKAQRESMKTVKKAGNEVPEADIAKLKALKMEKRAIMEPVKKVAEKYQGNIKKLQDELVAERAQWREDMKGIVERHMGEDHGDMKRKHHKRGDRKAHHHESDEGFLLLDPNATKEFNLEQMGQMGTPSAVTIYPNPATTNNKIELEVEEPGQVTIELMDSEGRVILRVLDEQKEAGKYTLDVDLKDVDNGLYYYRISDASGTQTKKLVVNRF